MNSPTFARTVARAFGDALQPLNDALESEAAFSELLGEYGWQTAPEDLTIGEIRDLFAVASHFETFQTIMQQVRQPGADLLSLSQQAISAMKDVMTQLQELGSFVAQPQLPFPFDQSAFWQSFPSELATGLLSGYLETYQGDAAAPLIATGILEKIKESPSETGRIPYVRTEIRWDRFPQLLTPEALIDQIFHGPDGELLQRKVIDLLGLSTAVQGLQGALAIPPETLLNSYYATDHPLRDQMRMLMLPLIGGETAGGAIYGLGLTIMPVPPESDPDGLPDGIALGPAVHGAPSDVDLGPLTLKLDGGFTEDQGLQVEMRRSGVSVVPGLPDGAFAELRVTNQPDEPIVLVGSSDGHRLEAEKFGLGIRAEGTLSDGIELKLDAVIDSARLVFDAGGKDSFTRKVAGGDEQKIGFDTGLTWSTRHGLSLRGQVGLKSRTSVNLRLGPIRADGLTVEISNETGDLVLKAGATGKARLGPVEVIVDGLGLGLVVSPVGQSGALGNFGAFDVDFDVTSPSGYGLSLQVSDQIQGAGFLSRDDANDCWVGAFNLRIKRLKFSGIAITERDSMLGVLWFQGLKIPLFGGTITGAGVLVAHNRRSDRDAFLQTLGSGGLEALVFPSDPVGQAPILAASLTQLFPYQNDRVVAGLLARWVFGESAELVVIDLGLLLEFAGRKLSKVLLVGRGEAKVDDLPKETFFIGIDLFGEWDLGRDEVLVLAKLRDSHLAGGELTGDGMIYSGPLAGYLMSVGGFNPRYKAPSHLPSLRRLTVRLVDKNNLKVGAVLYVALTTTNVQFGVNASLWAGAGGFTIAGVFMLDALVQFDFSFVVDLMFGVTLKRGSKTLATVSFEGVIEGFSPLSIDGKAKLKLLFLSVSVPVHLQIGSGEEVRQPLADAEGPLRAALQAQENWISALDESVILTERAREGVWASGMAPLKMSQKAVPLGLTITRIGPSPLAEPKRFALTSVSLSGAKNAEPVEEEFSIGLYQDVDLDEVLAAPITDRLQSGFEIGANAADAGVAVAGDADYEEITLDRAIAPEENVFMQQAAIRRPARRRPQAGIKEDISATYRPKAAPIKVKPPRYATTDKGLFADMSFGTKQRTTGFDYGAAREAVEAINLPGSQVVVRRYEAYLP